MKVKFISTAFFTALLFSSPAVVMASGDDVPLDEYSAFSIFNPTGYAEMTARVNYSIDPTDVKVIPVYSGDVGEYSAAAVFNPEAFAAKWKADSSKDRVNYSIEPTSEAVLQIFPDYKDGQR